MRILRLCALMALIVSVFFAGNQALAGSDGPCYGEAILEGTDLPEYSHPTELQAITEIERLALLRLEEEQALVGRRELDPYPGFYRDWVLARTQAFAGLLRVAHESDADTAVYRGLIDGRVKSELTLQRGEHGWAVSSYTYLVPAQVCAILAE